ncbi:MAG TPA: prepilin-type N-terminal cleavage/methylation domain-containing protein [Armatimonadota bacterium]|jgi:prepilin-type N-terminal cleavage/methylation domain-containing protein/prepilin-type processing-associated H-X9-DG protein
MRLDYYCRKSRLAGPGFTLLELLVVIAIIAVLAAILFPVFALVKRRAYATTCVSNLHQLTDAMTAYADDNDSHLPRWWFQDSETTWDAAIFAQVKSVKAFDCPANSARLQIPIGGTIRGYAFPRNVSGLAVTELKRPADTVLLFEKGAQLVFDWNDSTAEFFSQMWAEDDNLKTYPHGEGKNFAYTDGHVAWSKTDSGPFAYRFPNVDSHGYWPVAYCGNKHDPLGVISNNTDPGANLPE